MTVDFFQYNIEQLAEQYARSRTTNIRPLSMRMAIRAMRTILPDSPHSDKELASIIAAKAVRHGHVIDFDTC